MILSLMEKRIIVVERTKDCGNKPDACSFVFSVAIFKQRQVES